jgi:hypothetical protein
VQLKLLDGQANKLKDTLDGIYGAPISESPGILRIVIYQDRAKNNRIELHQINDITNVYYRPLKDENASGL